MEERSPSALTPLRRTRSVLPLPLLLQPPTYTTMTTTICQVVTIPRGKRGNTHCDGRGDHGKVQSEPCCSAVAKIDAGGLFFAHPLHIFLLAHGTICAGISTTGGEEDEAPTQKGGGGGKGVEGGEGYKWGRSGAAAAYSIREDGATQK